MGSKLEKDLSNPFNTYQPLGALSFQHIVQRFNDLVGLYKMKFYPCPSHAPSCAVQSAFARTKVSQFTA